MRIILCCILACGTAQAQNLRLFRFSEISLYAASAADVATTWHDVTPSNNVRELNPILGQSKARQMALIGGTTVVLSLITNHLYKTGHPRAATILNFVIAGEHGAAAAHNGWR